MNPLRCATLPDVLIVNKRPHVYSESGVPVFKVVFFLVLSCLVFLFLRRLFRYESTLTSGLTVAICFQPK